ncbi:MAG: peptidoglycan recognition family protein, partial [Oscillospiraceae bacterium]|nr:peptidoglycan recognition family protein [Oscillospiraceae bacterium]
AIDTITIHCIVGQWTAKQGCDYFATTGREVSANYVVGKDGSIGLSVEEKDRSWCSSSNTNDHRAITIEVASDTSHPYAITAKAYAALLDLLEDVCRRNGIEQLLWKADKSLIGQVKKQNMTVHRWFTANACPGEYLYSRHGEIAAEINRRLSGGSSNAGGVATTPENPTTGHTVATAGVLSVGMEVDFTGNRHYTSSCATAKGKNCKAGRAKITAIVPGYPHPYHCVAVSGKGSTVYGWVDTGDVQAVTIKAIQKGDKVKVLKAITYTGGSFKVYCDVYDVIQVNGDRVVIGQGKTVTAAVNSANLQVV